MDASELADLFRETGSKHHAAFIEADGVDPEWALWYSSYLQGATVGSARTDTDPGRAHLPPRRV